MKKLLRQLGAEVEGDGRTTVDCTHITNFEAPYELVKTMRASALVLGPLVGRHGQARGVAARRLCHRGAAHRSAFARAWPPWAAAHRFSSTAWSTPGQRLHGATIVFDMVTVTGTENLMMAAALAKGLQRPWENAACEPEVEEMARVLNKMGARVRGAGTSLITIEGWMNCTRWITAIIPDRVEAGTLMVAAAVTRGNVLSRTAHPSTWTR